MASALSVYTVNIVDTQPHKIPKLTMINTHFSGNRHLVSKPITTVSITSHIIALVRDCNFTDNYGSAITAYTTKKDHVLTTFKGPLYSRTILLTEEGPYIYSKQELDYIMVLRLFLKVTLLKM